MTEDFQQKLIDDRTLYVKNGPKIRLRPIPNVNVNNEQQMQSVELRPPFIVKQRDVFKKTKKERAKLKELKAAVKEDLKIANLPRSVQNANPTKIIQAFDQFDLGSYRGLAKNISNTEPEKFCTLQGYLEKRKKAKN